MWRKTVKNGILTVFCRTDKSKKVHRHSLVFMKRDFLGETPCIAKYLLNLKFFKRYKLFIFHANKCTVEPR